MGHLVKGTGVSVVLTLEKAAVVVNCLWFADSEGMLEDDGLFLLHEITQEFPGKFEGAERLLSAVTPYWVPPGSKKSEPNVQKFTRLQIAQMVKDQDK